MADNNRPFRSVALYKPKTSIREKEIFCQDTAPYTREMMREEKANLRFTELGARDEHRLVASKTWSYTGNRI